MNYRIFCFISTLLFFVNFGIGQITIPDTGEYLYSSDKSKLLTLPMTAFSTMQENLYQFERDSVSTTYKRFIGGDGSAGYATAPVELPNQSEIKELSVWLHNLDFLNGTDVIVSLVRSDKTSFGVMPDTLAQVVSLSRTVFPNNFMDFTIDHAVIDNDQYTYSVLVECNKNNTSNARLFGAQIHYAIRKVH